MLTKLLASNKSPRKSGLDRDWKLAKGERLGSKLCCSLGLELTIGIWDLLLELGRLIKIRTTMIQHYMLYVAIPSRDLLFRNQRRNISRTQTESEQWQVAECEEKWR